MGISKGNEMKEVDLMKRTAVIAANGCEEGETLTIVDIIRRAGLQCELVGLEGSVVTGAHDIVFACDRVLAMDVADYDMIVLPGGYGGATAMRDSDLLMAVINKMDSEGKFVTAMCAAPIALERAGVLNGRNYTAYMGYDQKINAGNYQTDEVVVDGNLVTSRGPATAYAFAYKLAELLGGDAEAVKKRMIYDHAFRKEA
jgi:4-methyl-5(b-hydroxyethyl)-thiazole monophosphate biosynthesis